MANLGQQTGADAADITAEAKRIVIELGLISRTDEMPVKDATFVEKMFAQLEEGKWAISGKQLFYLRDLHARYNV